MSGLMTVARPYAKAAFDFAVEHQNIKRWQTMLSLATTVVCNEYMVAFLSSSTVPEDLSKFFNVVCGNQLDKHAQNLIKLMVENGRLIALPSVLAQFIQLRNTYESIAEVDVISTSKLSKSQLAKISIAMKKRLSCKLIKLNCKIDKSLIAGVVIRVGDLVIDGSVRSRLDHLADVLQS